MTYKVFHISPMVPSYDIPATTTFFTDLLEFQVLRDDGTYVIVGKDGLNIHILRAGDIGEMEFYLEVDNVDKVWESVKGKIGNIKIKEPFDQEYGMREMHVVIPKTKTLLFIGHNIHP